MQKLDVDSRALRRLAEALFHEAAEDPEVAEAEGEDFVTSLVRQWITYEGNATMFLDEQEVYLVLGRTPLGKPCVIPELVGHGWVRQLTRDWKVSPDDLPDALEQLNRGQSAEVVNRDGVPLRLWVNPREKRRGVQPLVQEDLRPEVMRDYYQIAADELEEQFGGSLEPEELDDLARSVAKQWQRHGGHASLFLDGNRELHFQLSEYGDGTYNVAPARLNVNLERSLSSLGFSPEVLPEVLTRINLGQEIELRDRQGAPSVLWHDPMTRRLCVRKVGSAQPAVPGETPPVLCPTCTAALPLWREGQRAQTCSHCGHTILPR
jgi:hypothetical protein